MTQVYRLLPSPRPGFGQLGDMVLPIESGGVWDGEPAATTPTAPRQSDEVDLDKLIAKLKALAAKAQQLPPPHRSHRHLVIAAAIALSVASGAVAAQYLIPGHSRAPGAPGKTAADALQTTTRR